MVEAVSKDRLLREAWRQLQWFAMQEQNAKDAKAKNVAECNYGLHHAYILKCAEVYHQIDAALNDGVECIEEDFI